MDSIYIFVNEVKEFHRVAFRVFGLRTWRGVARRGVAWRVDFYVPSMKWHLINIIFIDRSSKQQRATTIERERYNRQPITVASSFNWLLLAN